jgi:hypothetical protein
MLPAGRGTEELRGAAGRHLSYKLQATNHKLQAKAHKTLDLKLEA